MLILSHNYDDGPIHIIDKDTGETILKVHRYDGNKFGYEADDNIEILRDKLVRGSGNED